MTPGRARGAARDAGAAGEGLRERFQRTSGSPSTGSSAGPWTPSTAASRCWCRRPPARARPSSPTMPPPGRWRWGARPSTPRRSRPSPTRSSPSSSQRYGEDRVGLLTGDVSHQAHAPIVVMTTEVLRNMLFARSSLLDGLDVVVLDEVHYLQDPYRGSVWEEVLVLTPAGVAFVSLSATVSNATDFGAWLTSVRGPPGSSWRPIDRSPCTITSPWPSGAATGSPCSPPARRASPTRTGLALDDRRRRNPRHRFRVPRRTEVVEYLAEAGMLPAITFIFSRAACDDATRQCLQDGIRLTTPRGAGPDPPADRGAVERLERRRPAHPGVRSVVGGPRGRDRPAPRRSGAGLPPGGRAVLLRGPAQGGVRHRDPGPRHQHAGPDGGGGAVRQVPRIGHLGADLGRVPAADRAGRSAGHRHRGPRLRAVVAGHPLLPGGPHGAWPRRPTWCPPSTPPTTWRSTWSGGGRARRPTGSWPPPTASGRPRPGSVSLAAQLDRRLAILEERGFIDGWRMTEAGRMLASIYHESDLLVTEALREAGCSTGSIRPRLAGVVSALTFEARRAGEDEARAPPEPVVVERLARLEALAGEAAGRRAPGGLRRTRRPDSGLARAVVAWARGATLDSVLRETDVAPGRLRAQRPPAHRPGPPAGPGGPGCRAPVRPPTWRWPCSGGAWWGPTTRPRWGPRLTRRSPS